MITMADLIRESGICPRSLCRYLKDGIIHGIKVPGKGNKRFYPPETLETLRKMKGVCPTCYRIMMHRFGGGQ